MGWVAGVTIDPEKKRVEMLGKYPDLRHWYEVPFKRRADAIAWEDRQYGCERWPESAGRVVSGDNWWGYRFQY